MSKHTTKISFTFPRYVEWYLIKRIDREILFSVFLYASYFGNIDILIYHRWLIIHCCTFYVSVQICNLKLLVLFCDVHVSHYTIHLIIFHSITRYMQHTLHSKKSMFTWWHHQMETFSALLAFCAGNSPVTGEFLAQRPVTQNFDVFFDLRLNKRLSKSRGWWFETPSGSSWRHCNEFWKGFNPYPSKMVKYNRTKCIKPKQKRKYHCIKLAKNSVFVQFSLLKSLKNLCQIIAANSCGNSISQEMPSEIYRYATDTLYVSQILVGFFYQLGPYPKLLVGPRIRFKCHFVHVLHWLLFIQFYFYQ